MTNRVSFSDLSPAFPSLHLTSTNVLRSEERWVVAPRELELLTLLCKEPIIIPVYRAPLD